MPIDYVRECLKQIRLHDVNLTKVRLGSQGDGGYVVLDELCSRVGAVYSFGIGDDVQFELEFKRRYPQAEIKCFDPTIDRLPAGDMQFYRMSAREAFPRLSFELHPQSLLKMDVEGCEWDELGCFSTAITSGYFCQVVVEFHFFYVKPVEGLSPYFTRVYGQFVERTNRAVFAGYAQVLRELNRHFYTFHAHANNSLPLAGLNGWQFPPLLEISYVRKDLVNAVAARGGFPVEGLDEPNKTDRPDVVDWYPFRRV